MITLFVLSLINWPEWFHLLLLHHIGGPSSHYLYLARYAEQTWFAISSVFRCSMPYMLVCAPGPFGRDRAVIDTYGSGSTVTVISPGR